MMEVLEVAPDRPETSLGNGGPHLCHVVHQHVVEVLVMAPAHDHILYAAPLLVDAQLRVVPGVIGVRVVLETLLAKDDGRLRLATHGESISHHCPLRLTIERHDLPEIMD